MNIETKNDSKPRLLIVDDEALILELLTELFADKFEIMTSESGLDALRIVHSFRPHIVLTDYHCPAATNEGGKLCAAIKMVKSFSDVPVIMMSSEQELGQELMMAYGADAFFAKPFEDIGKLIETVESFAFGLVIR